MNHKKCGVLCLLLLICVIFAAGCGEKDVAPVNMEIDEENGSNNILLGGLSVLVDDTIYFVAEGENGGEEIHSMGLEGENETVLYVPESNLDQISYLNCDGTNLYFMESIYDPQWLSISENRIRKLELPGGEVTTLGNAGMVAACLTYHDGYLYYTDTMESGRDLMRLSAEGGTPENLCDFGYEDFLIRGDRIWTAPYFDTFVASWDLGGNDKQVYYTNDDEFYGISLYAYHGNYAYVHQNVFEAEGQSYVVDLETNKEIKIDELGRETNTIGNYLFTMMVTNPSIVSDGDLSPYVNTGVSDVASGSDLQESVSRSEQPATNSDLEIEGNPKIFPGSARIIVYEILEDGSLKYLTESDYPGTESYVRDLGCISGHWNFYTVGEPGNGRTLYKENLNE